MLGSYEPLRNIEWQRVQRLVFVCKGNICRSPYAEARARVLGLASASFGLETPGGYSANPLALRIGQLRGIDLTAHVSKSLRSASLGPGDLVMVFEPEQLKPARELLESFEGVQLSLLGLWARPSRPHVADPYGHTDA
jgi:protein-tyrosine phosphatase